MVWEVCVCGVKHGTCDTLCGGGGGRGDRVEGSMCVCEQEGQKEG